MSSGGPAQSGRVSRALCEAAAFAAEEMGTRVMAVLTESGLMARRLSALRPDQRIVALTNSRHVQNELALIWGVEALIAPSADSTEEILKSGERTLLEAGVVEPGEMIVVMAGRLSGLGLSSSVTLSQSERSWRSPARRRVSLPLLNANHFTDCFFARSKSICPGVSAGRANYQECQPDGLIAVCK